MFEKFLGRNTQIAILLETMVEKVFDDLASGRRSG